MAFLETPRFPDTIAYQSAGGPGFSTSIVRMRSGREERVSRWSSPLHIFNVAEGVKSHADLADLKEFYWAVRGASTGFRFKDFHDCTSSPNGLATELGGAAVTFTDVVIGTGDGSTTSFQLIKFYTAGILQRTRTIKKPVWDTVLVGVNGVQQGSGDFMVDKATGIVTFDTAPPLGHAVTAGFEFDVPARFSGETDALFEMSLESYGHGTVDLLLQEILEGTVEPDEFFYGGSSGITLTADQVLSAALGRVIVLAGSTGSQNVKLPDKANVAMGGPQFYIQNDSSHSHTLKYSDGDGGASVGTMVADALTLVVLGDHPTNGRTWYAK